MDFTRCTKWKWRINGVTAVAVAGLLAAGAAHAARPSEKLAITAATWKAEKAELKVEGVSRHVDDVVLVRDAATRKLLGSAAVRRDGKWVLKIRDPESVPAKMRAELGGKCVECVVQNANGALATASVPAAGNPSE